MYGKIFKQIYDGSLRMNWKALITFQQMIVLCDCQGVVDMTHESLHFRTGIPLEILKEGISELEKPDLKSRSPQHQGCRILRIDEHRDWGWQLVNHLYYRNLASYEEKKVRERERIAEKRKQKTELKQNVAECCQVLTNVRDVAHTNTDTNIKKKYTKKKARAWPKDFSLTAKMRDYATLKGVAPNKVDAFFDDFRDWAAAKGALYKDWQAAFRIRVGKAPEYGKQFMAGGGAIDPDKQKLSEGTRLAAQRLQKFKEQM